LGWETSLRVRLWHVDEVIVLCAGHADTAGEMSAELRVVQELAKPYFLLWGRRGAECRKPTAAKHADNLHTWIWEIVKSQIGIATRKPTARLYDMSFRTKYVVAAE